MTLSCRVGCGHPVLCLQHMQPVQCMVLLLLLLVLFF